MSDSEAKEISGKEKDQKEEKERDSTKSPKKTPPGSAKGSSKGSAKGSARKPSSPKSGTITPKSPAPKLGRGTPQKGKKKEDSKAETPAPPEEENTGPPENVVPIFLASKTQAIYHCVCDEDVTKDNPFKIVTKEEILEDLHNRAAICDFHPFKDKIINYPGTELLLVYDYDFKYGQNFCIALTEEAKELLLNPPGQEGEGGEEGAQEEEDTTVYKYVPPESKEWISLGSEKDIKEESVAEMRRRLKVSVRRKRRLFGAPCEFKDRNVGDAKDGYIECTSYKDKTYDLKKIELDKGTQAIPWFQDSGTQTEWKYPRNANTQYYPREFSQKEQEDILNKKETVNFVESVGPRFELALQQNEIMDVFFIDWLHLGNADDTFGSKADNHLKEYQSFTDLQFSKEKKITCIQWHPTIKGVVAVAIAEKLSFDERIDNAAKVIMTPSLILIWSFTDPIHPQLLLEAPDDIYSFQFSPSDPNIIAGGCQNGQLVLWDISAHADRLKQPRGGNRNKKATVLPGFEDPNALKTPIVRYCAVSSIENSHHQPITDLQWLPDHMEINRMGVPQENKSFQCCQIFTCATDNCVLVWDTRPPKGPQQQQQGTKEKQGPKNPMGVPDTFKHLDLTWKPMLRVHLHKSEPGGDHAPTKFSIAESQGERGALSKATEGGVPDKEASVTGGYYQTGKPGSGKEKRTLQSVKTHFYVGSEDGEIVYVDWMPQKDQDTGKIQTPKPDFYHTVHDGPVSTVQRSPFFKDVVLCVGGWNFTIWKEGLIIDKNNPNAAEMSGPILQSAPNPVRLTAGHWSPSRPGVFYISKVDGSVDVWDLLDKTHEPSITQSVSPVAITSIYPFAVSHKQHLLAVGDNAGTLHILEIPWSLRLSTPNELTGVANYIEREVKRRSFVVQRWDFRETEKRELEAEAKRKAGIAPNVILTDEEIEYRQKMEYQAYVEVETNFLRELGILKEDDPLPET
ncbi:dynein axonemal intermediate chain 3-like isoform X2 [Mercenaria mercenaria]|uniref:dynein axonemal intermediate chain 3-like isoform X2 n=1 Tax=Mercenaria mercenaria TaxID=6596 RepID=UPI00234F2527|nr:dynein axonemal intermediate chain 3-like isoform X2 [Mercenaria mercenaria]